MMEEEEWTSPCEECNDSQQGEYHYWHGDIEEDYTLPFNYECVCYRCFESLNNRGLVTWKN